VVLYSALQLTLGKVCFLKSQIENKMKGGSVMYLKTFLLMAMVLLLVIGMGCTDSKSGGSSKHLAETVDAG
jgi:hypothetical protein